MRIDSDSVSTDWDSEWLMKNKLIKGPFEQTYKAAWGIR